MKNPVFRALFYSIFIGVMIVLGLRGVSSDGPVDLGGCHTILPHYYIWPYFHEAVCVFTGMDPCGNFARYRVQNAHAVMFDCLCRDITGHKNMIMEYQNEYWRPPILQTDAKAVCQARPHANDIHEMNRP